MQCESPAHLSGVVKRACICCSPAPRSTTPARGLPLRSRFTTPLPPVPRPCRRGGLAAVCVHSPGRGRASQRLQGCRPELLGQGWRRLHRRDQVRAEWVLWVWGGGVAAPERACVSVWRHADTLAHGPALTKRPRPPLSNSPLPPPLHAHTHARVLTHDATQRDATNTTPVTARSNLWTWAWSGSSWAIRSGATS